MSKLQAWWEQQGWPNNKWFLPALIFLLVAIGSLDRSSIFLHFDTPLQDVTAADLLLGCFGTTSYKPVVALLLTGAFTVGGVNPAIEIILLVVSGIVATAAQFRLTARLTGSARWAVLATLWFVSLPTILYYTRMHMGYPLAAFTLGLLLFSEKRYAWAGIGCSFAPAVLLAFYWDRFGSKGVVTM